MSLWERNVFGNDYDEIYGTSCFALGKRGNYLVSILFFFFFLKIIPLFGLSFSE